jgi:hypothetical protein
MQNRALLIVIKEDLKRKKKVIYNMSVLWCYFYSKVWFVTHNIRSFSQFSHINGMNNWVISYKTSQINLLVIAIFLNQKSSSWIWIIYGGCTVQHAIRLALSTTITYMSYQSARTWMAVKVWTLQICWI